MSYNNKLLSKNGQVIMDISKILLRFDAGDRVPTVTELESMLHISRGTIQNALRTLQEEKAVRIESRGHLGSFMTLKNDSILLEFAGVSSLLGAMPLPYSKKYEGLATGLISTMENSFGVPVMLSYMRGAVNRIAMVIEGRCDFAVTSKYAAQDLIAKDIPLEIVKEFGSETYCSSHVVIFHKDGKTEITDGMKIGIDSDSIDQADMVKKVCQGRKVVYCPVEYSSLLKRVIQGDLDATIWNMDEITDHMTKINYKKISQENGSDTNAVIVSNSNRPEIGILLKKMIKKEEVIKVQKLVESHIITPSY